MAAAPETQQEYVEDRLWWQQPFCPQQPTSQAAGLSKSQQLHASHHQWHQLWQMQQLQKLHQIQQAQLEQQLFARPAQLPCFTLQQQIERLKSLSSGQENLTERSTSRGSHSANGSSAHSVAPSVDTTCSQHTELASLQLQQLQQFQRMAQEQAKNIELDACSAKQLDEMVDEQEDQEQRVVSAGPRSSDGKHLRKKEDRQVLISLQQGLDYRSSAGVSQSSATSSLPPPSSSFPVINSPVLNFQLSLDAGASEDSTADWKEDADLSRVIQLEGIRNSEDALAAVLKVLDSLTPEMTLAALHWVARSASSSSTKHNAFSSDLRALLRKLKQILPKLQSPRSLSRLSWTLGKLEILNQETEVAIMYICSMAPQLLTKFSCQDLTNTLWGIARLYPATGSKAGRSNASRTVSAAVSLSASIVGACCERLSQLSAQCLSNALWSAARVGLRGLGAEDFLSNALTEISTKRQLGAFSPQGLANMSWAIAEFKSAGLAARSARNPNLDQLMRTTCIAICAAARVRIAEFQHQELSMLAWAMAKVNGRSPETKSASRRKPGKPARVAGIDSLMLCLAEEAQRRLPQLSPQSVSNLAWALATMEMLTGSPEHKSARQFLCAACEVASEKLCEYSPQAVANLLWAAVRTEAEAGSSSNRLPKEVNKLASAAARETANRLLEFSWRDLAGVAVAVSHRNLRVPEAWTFATTLVGMAAEHCNELTPQLMLNIAQSSVRIGVPADRMQLLVDAIAETIQSRGLKLNDVDLRQWKEVQQNCPTSSDRRDQARGYNAQGQQHRYSADGQQW
eukprot:TRINITY_DN5982_c0_g1_i1.p1 TRINITY_DN5982_c0_g1~~TRINITY_DN5982_c0_g1_i1.p1  ORF type:complete len:874 (-),score=179.14 TRINITY_DN5982_c0_g1_i1:94-2487(-)